MCHPEQGHTGSFLITIGLSVSPYVGCAKSCKLNVLKISKLAVFKKQDFANVRAKVYAVLAF